LGGLPRIFSVACREGHNIHVPQIRVPRVGDVVFGLRGAVDQAGRGELEECAVTYSHLTASGEDDEGLLVTFRAMFADRLTGPQDDAARPHGHGSRWTFQ
jgi:hypothetical protein